MLNDEKLEFMFGGKPIQEIMNSMNSQPLYLQKLPNLKDESTLPEFNEFYEKTLKCIVDAFNTRDASTVRSMFASDIDDKYVSTIIDIFIDDTIPKLWRTASNRHKKIDMYVNTNRINSTYQNQILGGLILAGWIFEYDVEGYMTHSSVTTFSTELLFSYNNENKFYLIPYFKQWDICKE